ncbi:MAG: hypothetical protein C0391_01385 [Anaerolinea sp.]|nr:hypothetical protein [Anaerolinea sp.]
MITKISRNQYLSAFLQYLSHYSSEESERLPSLIELSQELGISVASIREQLEVARIMGLIEVRPRTGIQKLPYNFTKTLMTSVFYALENDKSAFEQISDLRKHLESAYWQEAASKLTDSDVGKLHEIIADAFHKLHRKPPQIPHEEHKRFHLLMYQKLNNPFVTGLLEAYWQAYEAMGLDVYADLQYLEQVWAFHLKTVEAIARGDIESGYKSFADHIDLISRRKQPSRASSFE